MRGFWKKEKKEFQWLTDIRITERNNRCFQMKHVSRDRAVALRKLNTRTTKSILPCKKSEMGIEAVTLGQEGVFAKQWAKREALKREMETRKGKLSSILLKMVEFI